MLKVDQSTGAAMRTLATNQTVGTVPQLADYLINGYWQYDGYIAHHWGSSTVTYNFGNLTSTERALAVAALGAWQDVANITFVQTSQSANITFNHNGRMGASEIDNGAPIMTSATVSISADWVRYYGSGIETYSFQTYVHEIGHALGLGHLGPYNGDGIYGVDTVFANDTWQFSVMSYFEQDNYGGSSYRYVSTPMMADIYAVQSIYGASITHDGDSVYGFGATVGSLYDFSAYSTPPALTIWDAGGNDTLDCSGYSVSQAIDIGAGNFSSVGGLINNIAIAVNCTIENATGGGGNDFINGNGSANVLSGGGGNDSINGFGGNDIIDGGSGFDTVEFSYALENYRITSLSDNSVQISNLNFGSPDGTDTLKNVEVGQFSDGTGMIAQLAQAASTSVEQLITKLYVGYFNRSPDVEGLNYWTTHYQSLSSTAASFADPHQTETVTLYPFLADPEVAAYSDVENFVEDAYQNLFGRVVDGADQGVRYWATSIAKALGISVPVFGDPVVDNTSAVSVADALIAVIFGAQGSDADTIINKVAAALYYEGQLVSHNAEFSQSSATLISDVSSDPITVFEAEAATDTYIQSAPHVISLVGILDAHQSIA